MSVVLCGYNQAQYLRQAVESVLAQTYPNLELILMDNGSTDASREIARTYGSHPNVKLLLHEEAASIGTRANEGIAASAGEFISFLWADDWYLPGKTEAQMDAFARLAPDYGVVYSPGYRYNQTTGQQWHDGTLAWSGQVLERMLRNFFRSQVNMDAPLVRRECFLRFPFYEDVFLEAEAIFMRLATAYRFHCVAQPLVVTRDHQRNLGKAYEWMSRWTLLLLRRLEREEMFPPGLVPLVEDIRAAVARNLGWRLIRLAGEPDHGRRWLLASLDRGPRRAAHPRFIVGMGLSLLPRPLLPRVNALGNLARRHRENIDYVADIGPGARMAIPRD